MTVLGNKLSEKKVFAQTPDFFTDDYLHIIGFLIFKRKPLITVMLKKFIFVFFLTGMYQGLAQQKPAIKFPPLSVLIRTPDQSSPVVVPDPTSYLQFLPVNIKDSILSPQEAWDAQKQKAIKLAKYEKVAYFYQWYFTQLPALVPAYKRAHVGDFDIISEEGLNKIHFLFESKTTLSAQNIITLSEYYNYTLAEKLNLFLVALYKNISDSELLKVLKEWQITENKAIYIQDYTEYLNNFFQVYRVANKQERQNILSILQEHKLPLTSLLHEAFNANRLQLFKEILKNSQNTVHTLNYFSQNIGHLVSQSEWKKGEAYLSLLFSHSNIDWNQKDFRGWTPIFYALFNSEEHFFPAIRLLLKQANIKLDIVDEDKRGLLLLAREMNKKDVAQFLQKKGTPLPRYVSLQNSYMDENYNIVKMDYKSSVHLEDFVLPLNWINSRPSFMDFQTTNINEWGLPPYEIWNQFKYYFLLHTLLSTLNQEELAYHNHIMSLLLDESQKDSKVGKWIRAIYRGDTEQLKKLLAQDRSLLEKPLFYIQA